MMKRFFKNLSQSFCIYLLTLCNLINAIQDQDFDWLLWVSLGLAGLSLVLNIVAAAKGGSEDAEA